MSTKKKLSKVFAKPAARSLRQEEQEEQELGLGVRAKMMPVFRIRTSLLESLCLPVGL